jgi:GNAT superfamily N-acetyltransferase/predicted nucleotidyltransferase
MKLFINVSQKLIVENQPLQFNQSIDEIDEIENSIEPNLNKEIHIPKDVLSSFLIKDQLNPDIWTKDQLNPDIRKNLIKIAEDFFNDINIPKEIKIKDIIFTGSLANYNWSKFSDIDLHIVIDFNQFDGDKQIIEDYFYAIKTIWNQEHNIKIHNFPIEIYVQDINAKLVATAVYSVLNNKWVKKPTRETFKLDKDAIKSKANSFIYKLRDIKQDYKDKQYQSVVDKVTNIKSKIKNLRNSGLEKGGEFSIENLIFKTLRRTPFLDILDSFKSKAYDELMSIQEEETKQLEENDIINKTSFKLNQVEDDITINAIHDNKIIASITMEPMLSAYWFFEDEISEEQYDELFPEDKFMNIQHLVVSDTRMRGEGIAKKLMIQAIKKSIQLGYAQIYLNASPMGVEGLNLPNLIGFYQKFGFKVFLNQGNNALMILKLK